ncbi:response regulator [Paenibacillus sp. GCM10023252]|uniref:response regulator transcription factor n=1 Tax=Paenibacillus sp. GCM10023252 TaxID=3252649 RepID=UPI00360BAF87
MYTLMIVDDERLVVDTLAKTIPWSSIQIDYVHRAYSAEQALHIMNTHSIDIVITDIRMPKVSGLELIEQIRALGKRTKCIVYSGYSDFEYARQAMSSQVAEYLLKPARDEDILAAVERMSRCLDEEWGQIIAVNQASTSIRDHMPLLRSSFLKDLIAGKKLSSAELQSKLTMLQLPWHPEDRFAFLVIRLEEAYAHYDAESLALFEFAIANIAEETMAEHFHLCHTSDSYDYLVFLVKLSDHKAHQLQQTGHRSAVDEQTLLEQSAMKLQDNITTYLKRSISLVVSTWHRFPEEVPEVYQACLGTMRRYIGNQSGIYMTLSHHQEAAEIQTLQSLYDLPSLAQLLDMGSREATLTKINKVMDELESKWSSSKEHLLEAYFHLSSAFVYAVHKNGKSMEQLLADDYDAALSPRFLSIRQLKEWAVRTATKLFYDLESNLVDHKSNVIPRVKQYIHDHLAEDVTLQALADHIYLHPVYLSTIFKSETGENIRDYIIGQKMEKAAWLLKNSNDKIYQICSQIGYQNPPYFIKLFKKYYGQTPQEYRETSASSSGAD